ncbi:YqkE family protein [Paenibacillus piri]|uniref:DUF3886 domain-containing protein n=1 Tax=Paenibacillus piri TaxID=2547395 RepID=A0A4R5KFS7_9BACL|nr:YqkE family protein [Paenibacillus piri]TDF94173.1 DUF3886 domain-containing protein [Paenibacillus piri]
MAKKRPLPAPKPASSDKPATLKDLLSPDIVEKLNSQAGELKAAEEKRKEQQRLEAAEARKAEQKRLDNDFGHLLEQSLKDWKKYK